MASHPWRLLCAAVCLTATSAPARAAEAPSKRLALVLLEKGSPDRALVDGFLAALADVDGRAPSISIIAGREIDRRLGRAHLDAVRKCGADVRCVGALGEKVGATHVLLGRATAQPDGVSMQWLLVGARTGEIVGKLLAKLGDPADAAPAAAARVAQELLDVPAADLAPPPARAGASAPVAVPAAPRPEPAPPYWTASRVAVASAVGLGLLGLGAGVYFGNRAQPAGHEVARDPRGTALGMALPVDRSRRDDRRATALLAAGGLLVAGGAAVWGHEWLVTPVISVDTAGGTAGVAVTW